MRWENYKKCPKSVCNTGMYNKSKSGYTRGNILSIPKVSIRPICLLKDHYAINDFDLFYRSNNRFATLSEAVDYIIENIPISFESLLQYTKIKSEINAHNS